MRSEYIIIFIGVILFTVFLLPITVSEPYYTTEIFKENYTVVEPRNVQVADWIKEDIAVTQSFEDMRYSQRHIEHDISMSECSDKISSKRVDLAIPEWGKIVTIPYEGNFYFAGYEKGFFTRKGINTFDKSSREGHIYKIIQNEKVNITLKQGEYLSLDMGYNIQVNKIDDNLKSSKTTCSGYGSGHYDKEDGEDPYGSCTTTVESYQGAMLTLSDRNILKTWNVRSGSTLTYETTLSGGETVPIIVVHINNVTNSTVNVDAIFQISKDHVATPGGLGAEMTVNIKNINTQPGMFEVYTGFVLNSTLGFEIGKLSQVFLNPSESAALFYNTDKDIEHCRYYAQSISKVPIPENFTNYRDVNFTKRITEYRNVTLYIDVTKERLVEKNVTKYRSKTIYGLFNYLKINKKIKQKVVIG